MAKQDLIADLKQKIQAVESGEGFGISAQPRTDVSASQPDAASVEVPGQEEAYAKILRLISIREHSTASLRKRLVRDGFAENAVEAALGKACRLSLVDDLRYSDMLVRMRLSQGKGLQPVLKEIEGLGIDPADVPSFAEYAENGRTRDLDRALALLERKPPRSKNLRDGAFRKLVSQGFSTSVASEAAKLWECNRRCDDSA